MTIIGLFPRQDKVYQEFQIKQIKIARNRISHFPILDKIFENFIGYENLLWKESRNKIFLECTVRLQTYSWNDQHVQCIENYGEYPHSIQNLEETLSLLGVSNWNSSQINELKNRLTSYDYFTSASAVSEILMVHSLGKINGFENIEFNPAINNGRKSDLVVNIEQRKIFLELTAPTTKESEKKIQRIFDDLAEYLGNRNWDQIFNFIIWVNTASFPCDEVGNINEEQSKKMLRVWAERLKLDKLAGCEALINCDYDYSWIRDKVYFSELMNDGWHLPDDLNVALQNQPKLKEWANTVRIKDISSCPFESIGCGTDGNGVHIEIQGNMSYPSFVGLLEEKSFLNKIANAIREKIKHKQFEVNNPAIIVLKASFWANDFETDRVDFNKIKIIIENELVKTTFVSGVLIYSSDYRNGRFIENKNATNNIKITTNDLEKLGISF
jgi:hypothetical protein